MTDTQTVHEKAIIEQLRQYDEYADELYPKLLETVGVQIDRETGEIIKDKTGNLMMGFGIPDLIFRLDCQAQRERRRGDCQDSVARARIWRHIAEATKLVNKGSEGSIPDINEEWQLNQWLPENYPKFSRAPIQRCCEDCGHPWWSCTNHFATVPPIGSTRPQQEDCRKPWLCFWCVRMECVLRKYKMISDIPEASKVRKKRAPNVSFLNRLRNVV
jgi:hypothetical protein